MNNYNHKSEDIIDLKVLFFMLWNKKISIATITSIFAILSIFYSLSLPNIYQSSATLIPTTSNKSLSGSLSSFSSIANIAGIQVPNGEASKAQEAIKRINSLEFFSKYFLPEIKLQNLMAISQWLPEENLILYDSSIFDVKNDKWVVEDGNPNKKNPSNQEAFLAYKESLSISEDIKSSFVTITMKHKSPFISKKWVDLIIKKINSSMRTEDEKVALNSITFLNEYSKSINIQSLRSTISKLQESQMQILMIASSSDSYIFKTLDSAVVPEIKLGPKRSLICILGTLLGFMISTLSILILNYFKNPNKNIS